MCFDTIALIGPIKAKASYNYKTQSYIYKMFYSCMQWCTKIIEQIRTKYRTTTNKK